MKHLLLTTACLMALGFSTQALANGAETNIIEELNPFDPNIESTLLELDQQYIEQTGKSPYLDGASVGLYESTEDTLGLFENTGLESGCRRITCAVYANIKKSEQKMYLYVNGQLQAVVNGQLQPSSTNEGTWLVSTGLPGHETPTFDRHPNGRIYDQYSSRTYPGGQYIDPQGRRMGNMPYAVFISGGFAMHGTPVGNYSKLGRKASHGCVRMHSENGLLFNRLVRQYGIDQTWIHIEN